MEAAYHSRIYILTLPGPQIYAHGISNVPFFHLLVLFCVVGDLDYDAVLLEGASKKHGSRSRRDSEGSALCVRDGVV
ncbi:hypothetical protein MRX96_046886 [Rhipicephalus microplus]